MSAADTEFLRLVKKDIDYFESAIERFEELVPRVSAPIQDQWRLQATVRRNFAMELEILLHKAEECASGFSGPTAEQKRKKRRRHEALRFGAILAPRL